MSAPKKVKTEFTPETEITDSLSVPADLEQQKKSSDPTKPKRKYRSRARARSPATVERSKKARRNKANDRERNRMHSLNEALEYLRCSLPPMPDESKLTKIETLRMAHNYILTLTEMLKMDDSEFVSAGCTGSYCEYHPNPPDTPPFSSYPSDFYPPQNHPTTSGHSPPDINSVPHVFPREGSFYGATSSENSSSASAFCEPSVPFMLQEDTRGYIQYSVN